MSPGMESSGSALPRLKVSRDEAASRIKHRVEIGRQILEMPISSDLELKAARSAESSWSQYNVDLLKILFESTTIAAEYTSWSGFAVARSAFADRVRDFQVDVVENIEKLESILGRLELFEESGLSPRTSGVEKAERPVEAEPKATVFVVHGHDEGLKEKVARFLERLGLTAIILHERANGGRTLIEKFEAHSGVDYAVVLMSADDACGDERRPRQNVVFELGYFYGHLGRSRVAALVDDGLTGPSDFQGIAYIPLSRGDWRVDLGRELREAGFDIDLNKAL